LYLFTLILSYLVYFKVKKDISKFFKNVFFFNPTFPILEVKERIWQDISKINNLYLSLDPKVFLLGAFIYAFFLALK